MQFFWMLAMYVLTRTANGSICLNTVLGLGLCSTDGLISYLKPETLYGILFYFVAIFVRLSLKVPFSGSSLKFLFFLEGITSLFFVGLMSQIY
jgi:hypothetical protein